MINRSTGDDTICCVQPVRRDGCAGHDDRTMIAWLIGSLSMIVSTVVMLLWNGHYPLPPVPFQSDSNV